MKLAIIIPYRNRKEYLDILLEHLPKYLEDKNNIHNYDIIVSEQLTEQGFNRGLSVNAGVAYCRKFLDSEYLIAHNVDMIPVRNVDYSYRDCYISWFLDAGGFNCSLQDFIKINGYCNTYSGWGTEDTDLLDRVSFYNLRRKAWAKDFAPIEKPVICNLEFNDSYDSKAQSRHYWHTEDHYPWFITPKEYNLPDININKQHQWHEQNLMKNNENKRDHYLTMSKELKDNHYMTSGLNQIDCNFTTINNIGKIHFISYYIESMYKE